MLDRISRFAPATGVVFAVLSGITIVITPSFANSAATGQEVITFYEANYSMERTSVVLAVAAFSFFMAFAATLRSRLRRTPSAEGPSALLLASAVLLTTGFLLSAGLVSALSDAPSHLESATAQTLNLLDEDSYFLMPVGLGLFSLSAGLAIVRGKALPAWMGWVALAIAVISFTPLFGFALIALSLWSLAAAILLFVRPAETIPQGT